jgi:hypothetical protein
MSQQQTPPAAKFGVTTIELLKITILAIFLMVAYSIITNWDDFKARPIDEHKDKIAGNPDNR